MIWCKVFKRCAIASPLHHVLPPLNTGRGWIYGKLFSILLLLFGFALFWEQQMKHLFVIIRHNHSVPLTKRIQYNLKLLSTGIKTSKNFNLNRNGTWDLWKLLFPHITLCPGKIYALDDATALVYIRDSLHPTSRRRELLTWFQVAGVRAGRLFT